MLRQSATRVISVAAKPPTTALAKPHKTWPYSLPVAFLRPQVGTTYDMQSGNVSEPHKQELKPISILQTILYGRPDPDAKNMSSVKKNGFLYKLLHGVKEVDGEK
jgi:hypothetical protein